MAVTVGLFYFIKAPAKMINSTWKSPTSRNFLFLVSKNVAVPLRHENCVHQLSVDLNSCSPSPLIVNFFGNLILEPFLLSSVIKGYLGDGFKWGSIDNTTFFGEQIVCSGECFSFAILSPSYRLLALVQYNL